MRKKAGILALLVFAVMAFSACGKEPVDIQSKYVSMLEKTVSQQQIEKVEAYLDENLSAMGEAAADEMLIEYEVYVYPYYDGKVDYERLLERYGPYASDEYGKLCALKKQDQESPAAEHGKLALSRAALCERANNLEIFIRNNKDRTELVRDADALYKNYVTLILEGPAKEPNFDLKTKAFLKDAKTAYGSFVKQNPDAVLAEILKEYLKYVAKTGGSLDPEDTEKSKAYYNTCSYLEAEAGKRVLE